MAISESLINSKAKYASQVMKIEKKEASSGWMFCFSDMYGIASKKVPGEEKKRFCSVLMPQVQNKLTI